MIKVLIVAGTMNMGGIENQLMHLARKANRNKFQIDFTTTEKHPYFQEEIQQLGGKCLYIEETRRFHFFRYCKQIFSNLNPKKLDSFSSVNSL